MRILGIETSCDETSAAVVEGSGNVVATRSLVILSQDVHRLFGGVVPEVASRAHVEALTPAIGEALRAADQLEAEGIRARVLDLYSIKPIGGEALWAAASETAGIVVAEDHWPEGGLGEAVLSSLASEGSQAQVVTLGVREMPGSGKPEELLHAAGIDAEAIAGAAWRLLGARATSAHAH